MDPRLTIDPVHDVRELLTYPFMVHALEAGAIVAVMAAVVGWFMVLRRETFVGHTLSMMSFPGASFAALVGLPLTAGYLGFCAAGALVIAAAGGRGARRGLTEQSATVGIVQAGALALGFVFLSLYHGVLEGLESLLFGSFLGITAGQVLTLAVVAVVVLAILAVVGRPLLFATLDSDVARAGGVPVQALGALFLVVLGLAAAAAAQITGVLLVLALLVAPAATAQQVTPRVGLGLALSVAMGVVITWVALGLSYFTDDPVGFYVTTLAIVLYGLARGARRLGAR